MILLSQLFIPVLLAIGFLIFEGRKIYFKEFLIHLVIQLCIACLCVAVIYYANNGDSEIWNGVVTNKKKVKEAAQVTDMYAHDFRKVYDQVMKDRYGTEGSKAVFQWLQENNPQLDSAVYTKIQQIIEAGRNSFEAEQKMLLDKKRVYEIKLDVFPDGFIARFLGYPKIDLKEYGIVTSNETEKVFKDKKSEPLSIR